LALSEPAKFLRQFKEKLNSTEFPKYNGKIVRIVGLTVESIGPDAFLGEVCEVDLDSRKALCEVVGFKDGRVLLMPLENISGAKHGTLVFGTSRQLDVAVGEDMLGRILDGLGRPIDGRPLTTSKRYPLLRNAPHPLKRMRITEPFPLEYAPSMVLSRSGKVKGSVSSPAAVSERVPCSV